MRRIIVPRGLGLFAACLVVCAFDSLVPVSRAGKSVGPPVRIDTKDRIISRLALSPDGKTMATAEHSIRERKAADSALVFRQLPTGKVAADVRLPQKNPTSILFLPDGKSVALGHRAGADLIDLAGRRKQVVREKSGVRLLAISHDGKTLVGMTCATPPEFIIWDTKTGKRQRVLDLPKPSESPRSLAHPSGRGGVCACAFSDDGKLVIAERRKFGFGKGVHFVVDVWDAATGKLLGPAGDSSVEMAGCLSVDEQDLSRRDDKACMLRGGSQGGFRFRRSPDGTVLVLPRYQQPRLRAVAQEAGGISLESFGTGKQIQQFNDFDARWRRAVLLSADSSTMVAYGEKTGALSTTMLVWDVSSVRPKSPAEKLSKQNLEELWGRLSKAYGRACPAMRSLAGRAEQAVPMLREKLRLPVGAAQIPALLKQLDDGEFDVREAADRKLRALGHFAIPAMRKVLAAKPSAEVARRLRRIIDSRREAAEGEKLRLYRAVDVLEQIGTKESREVLAALADGGFGDSLAKHALAAGQRAKKRESEK